MLISIANVVYVLLAIGMVVLILLQRGSGAAAGAGFGGGASATVFGSRGASSFLSKSTKWMAIAFFCISMGMAWYATNIAVRTVPSEQDLGVMAQVPATAPTSPSTSDSTIPAAPAAQQSTTPDSTVPQAPAAQPAAATQAPATQPDAPTPAGG